MRREWHATLPCPLDRPVRDCAGHPLDEKPVFVDGMYRWICRDGQWKEAAPDETLTPQPWVAGAVPAVDLFRCLICGRERQNTQSGTCEEWDCDRWAKRERDRATTEVPRGSIRCSECREIETVAEFPWHRCIEKIAEGMMPARFA